jgi:hypothetical protein
MDAVFETMPDDEVLANATWSLSVYERQEMTRLIEMHHERELTRTERLRLDELMKDYRRMLVRKAQALEVAIARGLVPPS